MVGIMMLMEQGPWIQIQKRMWRTKYAKMMIYLPFQSLIQNNEEAMKYFLDPFYR
jgi:hypothetical protein